jgi:hypothetical protein
MDRPQLLIDVQCHLSSLPLAGTQSAHLQAFEDTEDFLRTPANTDAVHHLILKDAVGVYDKEPTLGKLLALHVHAVGPRDATLFVSGQREIEVAHPALFWRRPEPALMGRQRVGADSEHLATPRAELRAPTADRGQLGGSDE